jgi:hypothetical protein
MNFGRRMMKNNFIGIDNGVTGSIGIISNGSAIFFETPITKCLSYTKSPQHIKRIAWNDLLNILPRDGLALIERPMINPRAFKASESALRSLESIIIVLEMLDIEFNFIDSKEWQRHFFSSGIIGKDELKKASLMIGMELFPEYAEKIKKHKDADGLLIAEYLRKTSK